MPQTSSKYLQRCSIRFPIVESFFLALYAPFYSSNVRLNTNMHNVPILAIFKALANIFHSTAAIRLCNRRKPITPTYQMQRCSNVLCFVGTQQDHSKYLIWQQSFPFGCSPIITNIININSYISCIYFSLHVPAWRINCVAGYSSEQ